jgi:hypothetical protein
MVVPVALFLAVGCTETSDTLLDPQFNKSGGIGNPHFAENATDCSISSVNGTLSCAWQVSGLGKDGIAYSPFLAADIDVTWVCGTSSNRRTVNYAFGLDEGVHDGKGNVRGTLNAYSLGVPPFCLFGSPHTINYSFRGDELFVITAIARTKNLAPHVISYSRAAPQ